MIDKAFVLNKYSKEWQESSIQVYIENDITVLPIRLLVGCQQPIEEQLIWCPKHRRFEGVRRDNQEETVSDKGCKFTGIYVLVAEKPNDIHQGEEIETEPTRWRIYQKEPLTPIFLAADVAKLRFMVTPSKGSSPAILAGVRIEWKVRSISIDVSKGKFIYSSMYILKKIHHWYRNVIMPIPNEIVNDLFPILLQDACLFYGVEPIESDIYTGFNKIKNFMYYPLNRNVIEIWNIRKNRHEKGTEFKTLFPKDKRDIGDSLCRYIGIDNPPEDLIGICSDNIYTAFNYKLYRSFGFKSEKAIALLWDNEECLGQNLLELKYNAEDKKSFWWKRTADFIAWLINDNDEIKAAEMLSSTYYHSYEEVDREEMLEIFSKYKKRLPKLVLAQFKKEGFTFNVYKLLKHAEFVRNYRYIELNLPGVVQGLECSVNGYNFRLVRHTLYLRRISEALDSNLEYRWRKVADYNNVVFTIDVKGIYVAYAEVKWDVDRYNERNKFEVVSLNGYGDFGVSLPIKLVCYYWAASNSFYGAYGTLKLNKGERYIYRHSKYRVQPLEPNDIVYDNYRLDELLDFPAYARTISYYVILERRLKCKQDIKRMSLPNWGNINDETAYLHYLLPWITPVLEDAQNGNPGAENVLGWLYGSNQYIPVDEERENFWLKRSAGHGYLPAMEKLAQLNIQSGNNEQGKKLMIKSAKLGSQNAFSWCVENVTPLEYVVLG